MPSQTFAFSFEPRYRLLLRAFGATPGNSSVTVDEERFEARFGWFSLSTPRANVAGAEVTGPHKPLKALGIRTSLSDRGATFGSSTQRMTCVRFHDPVRISPVDPISHPGLSVSVDRPEDLAAVLNR